MVTSHTDRSRPSRFLVSALHVFLECRADDVGLATFLRIRQAPSPQELETLNVEFAESRAKKRQAAEESPAPS